MENNFPTDENLRLIFAEGHETWLHDQLNETKRLAIRFALAAAIGTAWMIGAAFFVNEASKSGSNCVRLEQGASLTQLVEQGAVPAGTRECVDDPLANLTQPTQEGLSSAAKIGLGLVTLIAFTAILAFGVETLRKLLKIRKFRAYLRDHGAFLQKYDRP